MINKISTLISILCLTGMLTACSSHSNSSDSTLTIGIIEPLEHQAMNEIVSGFSETLSKQYGKPVTLDIENAQNDPNLERAIIQKMRDSNDAIIAPIGVGATQMTLAMIHDRPVISLASDFSEQNRQALHPCNVAVVHDEISSEQLIHFVHVTYPHLTDLTLIHSSADKVLPQVDEIVRLGKENGIVIHHLMISTLPDLYTEANAIPAGTQAILVLKDNLIVSGIGTLARVAQAKQIPLITSDEGSVEGGAGLALGVHEREIGVQGALLTAQVLNGKKACDLPIVGMKNLTVFVNTKALKQEGQSVELIEKAAQSEGYPIENVNHHVGSKK